ncbi:response regulator transcription factor [Vibrio caribbeanicus]|uniref:Putative DNA-binding response regulator n=1 Tax=Vibrio caribbeanicus ATCC BAA-2122 TaxID=796620 RepID=E3BEE9_9VIBR|nr:response regulator [Vibrio caribbeanicus]EFP98566.1 putative DNA-binding response regulator [Vibrio caribbeanicus ATCC BAA-2122]
MKLLIIEDDPNYADIMACRMKRHGYECETINHADLVLHRARLWRPTHILLDLKLANENGMDLIVPLRAALPEAKIVLLTGFASIASAVEAMRRGASDYLSKPVDSNTLLNALNGEMNVQATELKTSSPEQLVWEHIQQVLATNNGNVSATARELGMHRRTLQRKLQKKSNYLS